MTIPYITAVVAAILAMPIHAADEMVHVKDWSFQKDANGSAYAFTKEESGSTLGVACSQARHCVAFLTSGNGCEVGTKYVVLVNADSGALSLGTTCADIEFGPSKQRFVVVIDDFNAAFNTLLKAHSIGVSMPLAGGHFKVARFSLKGSSETLSAVTQASPFDTTAPQGGASITPSSE
jgi:hypothetical protein